MKQSALRWSVSPAVDKVPVGQARAAAGLRVLVGLMWLYNVSWKRAPDFGQNRHIGLFAFTGDAVSHPVLPPYSWIVEHLVLAHFQVFGWVVLLFSSAGRVLSVEAVLAGLSRSTSLLRVWGALAVIVGVVTALGSFSDPLATRGYDFGPATRW